MAVQPEGPPSKEGRAGDVIAVHFTGCEVWLDEETLYDIHDQLLALSDEPGEPDVLLDFGNVTYLGSATLGTLVRLHKKLLARGRHLTVANLSPQVHEVFTITRLNRFLNLRSEGQAERALQTAAVPVSRESTAFPGVSDTPDPLASRPARRRQNRWIETRSKGV